MSDHYRRSLMGFDRVFDEAPNVDVGELIAGTLATQLAVRDRPIKEPYKFLQQSLYDLRGMITALESEEDGSAMVAVIDRFIARAEDVRRLPRDSVWFLPRRK